MLSFIVLLYFCYVGVFKDDFFIFHEMLFQDKKDKQRKSFRHIPSAALRILVSRPVNVLFANSSNAESGDPFASLIIPHVADTVFSESRTGKLASLLGGDGCDAPVACTVHEEAGLIGDPQDVEECVVSFSRSIPPIFDPRISLMKKEV